MLKTVVAGMWVLGLMLAWCGAASAQQAKCLAGKTKCMSKLATGLLKCEETAETPGKPTDISVCSGKVVSKFDGGTDPTKGCFEKLEAKSNNDCAQPMGNSPTLQDDVTSCVTSLVNLETATTTTTTTLPGGQVLKGALPATLGRFNFAGGIGLPGALNQCHTSFGAGTHVCKYTELQSAAAAGDLVGLKDTTNATVTAFWAIDNSQPALQQCNDDAPGTGSGLNWEYGTAHTPSRGEKVAIVDPGMGQPPTLGPLQMSQQCALLGMPAWVACCQ